MPRLRIILFGIYAVLLIASHFASRQVRSQSHPRPDQSIAHLPDGVEIAYSELNPNAAGLPVMLMHGSPMGSRCFDDYPPEWAHHGSRRLIMFDFPGFGGSTLGVSNYSARAYADWTINLIDKLGIERAHFVGYSMSGGVVAELAGRYPDRVASLTQLAAIGVQEEELTGDYQLNHLLHGIQSVVFFLVDKLVPHFGAFDRAILSRNYARNFFQTDQRPLRSYLERYTGPALILQGEKDALVPASAAREHHRIMPQSHLEWLPGGHITVLSRPDLVLPPLNRFFDEVGTGTATTRATASPDRLMKAAEPFTKSPFNGMGLLLVGLALILGIQASEDLTLIGAGLLVGKGLLGFWAASLFCFLGLVIGDAAIYLLGRTVGKKALRHRPLRWLVSAEAVDRQQGRFRRNLGPLVISSRFMPGMRVPMYFAAGVARAGFWRFVMWLAVASIVWAPLLVGLSALFGVAFTEWFSSHKALALVGLFGVVVFLWFLFRHVLPLVTWRGRRMWISGWRRRKNFEFWPRTVVYAPVFIYCLWLMLRHRSATVPLLANPGMSNGGLVEDHKSPIYRSLEGSAGNALPPWTLIPASEHQRPRRSGEEQSRLAALQRFMNETAIGYPIVLKPDLGCRGQAVAIIDDEPAAQAYLETVTVDVVAQPKLEGPEFGVFYIRHPDEPAGKIIGITRKEPTLLTGDGIHTLERLILADERSVCMAPFFLNRFADELTRVPAAGEIIPLSTIGTHCRGALFFDDTPLATPELAAALDRITDGSGLQIGRFDLKVPSPEHLSRGEDLRIIEFNGISAESTDIYDPKHSARHGWRRLMFQWRSAFAIGEAERRKGKRPPGLVNLFRILWDHRRDATSTEV